MDAAMAANIDATANESVVAVVGNLVRVSGLLGGKQTPYTLIITDLRLILAELDKDKVAAQAGQARRDAKNSGEGFWARWCEQLRAGGKHHEIYWTMSPEEILAESPGNLTIERSTIRKVKFRTGAVDDMHTIPDRIVITTTSDKYDLHVRGSLSAAEEAFKAAGLC